MRPELIAFVLLLAYLYITTSGSGKSSGPSYVNAGSLVHVKEKPEDAQMPQSAVFVGEQNQQQNKGEDEQPLFLSSKKQVLQIDDSAEHWKQFEGARDFGSVNAGRMYGFDVDDQADMRQRTIEPPASRMIIDPWLRAQQAEVQRPMSKDVSLMYE